MKFSPRARWSSEGATTSLRCTLSTQQRLTETLFQIGAVARRQSERQGLGLYLHLIEKRAAAAVNARTHRRDLGALADNAGFEPARPGGRAKIHTVGGVGLLQAGLAVALVVEDHDGEIGRALYADGGEAPQPHQHLAVSGDDQNAALGLRERKSQSYHARRSHHAPQGKSERMIARSGAVPRWGSEARDDKERAAPLEQRTNDLAAIELCTPQGLSPNDFTPIMA